MKKSVKFTFFAVAAMAAVACTQNIETSQDGPVAAQIYAGVSTRAVGNLWYGDQIGVMVTAPAEGEMAAEYLNVGYSTDANGVESADFTALNENIFFLDAGTITFAAYAPYDDTSASDALPGEDGIISGTTEDQSTLETRQEVDYLYASGATASSSKPTVNFNFHHVMSQLTIRLVHGEGLTADDLTGSTSTYSLSGVSHLGEFDVNPESAASGTAYATGNADSAWDLTNAYVTTEGDSYDISFAAILYPQTLEELVFSLTISGYTVSIDLVDKIAVLDAGKSYVVTLTVNENALIVGGSTVVDWDENDYSGSIGGDTEDELTLFPENGAADAYTDGELTITFASEPTLGTSGKITVYNASGEQVDYIDMADVAAGISQMNKNSTTLNTAMDVIECGTRYRVVWYNAVEVSGNDVIIRPHFGVLDYETEYYVTVDAEAVKADGFSGIEAGEWSFKTKASPSTSASALSVAKTGDSDFRTVQAAVTFATDVLGKDASVTINLADGTYEEQLYMRNKNNLTIKGASLDGTVLQYSNSNTVQNGVGQGISDGKPAIGDALSQIGGRPVILIESCDAIRFEDMTLNNTWSDTRAQAEVVYFNSSYRLAFVNCKLHSRQDTIETKGYNWFYNCTIDGNIDYIWGAAYACLFEDCTINTAADFDYTSAYLVQARCAETDYGYVFLNCKITADSGVPDGTVYLARSGGDSQYFDNLAYINCDLSGAKLNAAGWYTNPMPNPEVATSEAGWKFYPGDYTVDTTGWGTCCYILSANEAASYTRANVLGGSGDVSWYTE